MGMWGRSPGLGPATDGDRIYVGAVYRQGRMRALGDTASSKGDHIFYMIHVSSQIYTPQIELERSNNQVAAMHLKSIPD